MAFLEETGDGVNIGNPAGFMLAKIQEGISANQALADFREAGGAYRRQDWLRGYAGVRDALQMRPEIAGIEPSAIPEAGAFAEWRMGRGGQFATQVQMLVMDRESGIMTIAQYTHITDEPHTPDEAVQAGIDLFGQPATESRYSQRVMGGLPSGLYRTVPFR